MKLSRENVRLWAVVLGVPILFLTDLQVSYSLMELVCTSGRIWPLHLSSGLALVLMLAAGFVARTTWKRNDSTAQRRETNEGFLAFAGLSFALLFVLAELSLVVVKLFLVRC